ncbi:MAG: ribonuclease [Gaiellaceae bacterium]|nr:ribonuclease [Gaiellaceae bacterium]
MSERRKLVVFVPTEALDDVREALFAAGAGRIGNYERCSWHTLGTGTFRGGEGSAPSVGTAGRNERVQEARLETVYPVAREAEVVRALRAAHPYEEPVFDLYPLLDPPAADPVAQPIQADRARLFTDGGARGNPGPAAFAYVLEAPDGETIAAHGEAFGSATNNVAEYRALVAGLAKARELGVQELEVVSDSELMVKQMRGEYAVKNEALRSLFLEARELAGGLGKVEYTAVRREHNKLADQLVNDALDAAAR